MRPSVLAGLAALLPVALLAQANTGGPPATPVRVVNDTVFGTVVPDPYRWLENVQDSAVLQWLHAQDDYTRHLLAGRGTRRGRPASLAKLPASRSRRELASGRFLSGKS